MRAREGEREEVSVEDEENGRGSICEAAGGNWGLRAGQDQQISDLQWKGCIIMAYTIIRFQWNELLSDQKLMQIPRIQDFWAYIDIMVNH